MAELGWADLVVGADGASSAVRTALAREFVPTLDRRHCRYMWLGTDLVFEAFKFFIAETEHGVVQAHAYPYDERMSTFIVEMHERTWKRLGLGELSVRGRAWRGASELFADALEGHRLVANKSRWINFVTVRNRRWCTDNVVLLGDAAHTAHFSIGSGTKLAMEDAVSLAWAFRSFGDDVASATSAYEAERRPIVESTQRAAQASLEWFEGIGRYVEQERLQFAFNLLTRSRRVTYENLRLRDPGFVAGGASGSAAADVHAAAAAGAGAAQPRRRVADGHVLRGRRNAGRLPSRAPGRAGARWRRAGDDRDDLRVGRRADHARVRRHVQRFARCGLEADRFLCPCARRVRDRGADRALGAEGIDAVDVGGDGRAAPRRANWEVIAPSAVAYSPQNQVPRAMTRADMDVVRDQFVSATRGALQAGFDLLELHMAHGYLLSSFLSPVTNLRDDEYGGSLEGRARFPLEVLDACRSVWPGERPLSVRISATDWVAGGFDPDDAVALARMLAAHGCDIVDVSSGQVTPLEKPAFGRSYQTPFADRIRNEAGIPTIAVGAIASYDDVNTIVLRRAGRPVRARAPAPVRPGLDAARRRRAGIRHGRVGAAVPGRIAQAAGRARDRVRAELERTFDEIELISSSDCRAEGGGRCSARVASNGEPLQPQDLVDHAARDVRAPVRAERCGRAGW